MLVLIEMEIPLGLLIFFAEPAVCRGELSHDQPAAAEIADEAPENRIGDPGHGSKNRSGSEAHAADRKPRRNRLRWRCLHGTVRPARPRIVPPFFHRLILLCSAKQSPRHGGEGQIWCESVPKASSSMPRAWRARRFSRTSGGSAPRGRRCPSISACR